MAALIGSPVAHSLSPVIHRAAFAAAEVDWSYVAFDVPAGRAHLALDAVRNLGISGLSVTTPHKEHVADGVDSLAPSAAVLHSANTVVTEWGTAGCRLVGHNTDGAGFVSSLAAGGVDVAGLSVAVLGAGPAARSVVGALDTAGAGRIIVLNRTAGKAAAVVAMAPRSAVARPAAGAKEALAGAELIVNATSVGFGSVGSARPGAGEPGSAAAELPLDPTVLHAGHLVADLVYHPLDTALLRAARAAGARTFDGLGMLVHQAALQQQLWLGHRPDVTVMRAAAEAELARRTATDDAVSDDDDGDLPGEVPVDLSHIPWDDDGL